MPTPRPPGSLLAALALLCCPPRPGRPQPSHGRSLPPPLALSPLLPATAAAACCRRESRLDGAGARPAATAAISSYDAKLQRERQPGVDHQFSYQGLLVAPSSQRLGGTNDLEASRQSSPSRKLQLLVPSLPASLLKQPQAAHLCRSESNTVSTRVGPSVRTRTRSLRCGSPRLEGTDRVTSWPTCVGGQESITEGLHDLRRFKACPRAAPWCV